MGMFSAKPLPADIRARGPGAYIWRTGILSWGLPMSITMTIVDRYRGEGLSLGGAPWVDVLADLGFALFFFGLLGGALFGWLMWRAGTRASLPQNPPPTA